MNIRPVADELFELSELFELFELFEFFEFFHVYGVTSRQPDTTKVIGACRKFAKSSIVICIRFPCEHKSKQRWQQWNVRLGRYCSHQICRKHSCI